MARQAAGRPTSLVESIAVIPSALRPQLCCPLPRPCVRVRSRFRFARKDLHAPGRPGGVGLEFPITPLVLTHERDRDDTNEEPHARHIGVPLESFRRCCGWHPLRVLASRHVPIWSGAARANSSTGNLGSHLHYTLV